MILLTLFFKRTILVGCLLVSFYFLSGQTDAVLHQSFELEETTKLINVNNKYPYEIVVWPGNTILVETTINLENASPSILKYFIKSGRYQLEQKLNSTTASLALKPMLRKEIHTSLGKCTEQIKMRIFVPEDCYVQTKDSNSLIAAKIDGKAKK